MSLTTQQIVAAAYLKTAKRWWRDAENERTHGRPRMAKECMRQYIIWRSQARRISKKEVRP